MKRKMLLIPENIEAMSLEKSRSIPPEPGVYTLELSTQNKTEEIFFGSATAIQDLSVLKLVKQALHESEQRFRLFIKHSPVALAMFDRDMRYLSVSSRWLSDYGGVNHELCGLLHYEIFPEISERWKELYRRGLNGELLEVEADRFEQVDGSVKWVNWKIRPWYNASGNIGGIVIFIEDITKRKLAEEVLSKRNERYRVLMETMLQGVVHRDADGKVISMNPAAEQILGKNREQFLGSSPILKEFQAIRKNRETFPLLEHPSLVALRTGLPVRNVIMGILNPKFNDYRWVNIDAVPVYSQEGSRPVEVFAVFEDVTDRENQKIILEELVIQRTGDLIVAKEEAEKRKEIAETRLSEIKKLQAQLETEKAYLQEEIKLEHNCTKIIGQSDAIKYVLYQIEQIASSDTTVLILGETGTGKELIARAIHDLSLCKDRTLVKVNCAALPANLIESELFGHERGAFTGSHAKHIGRFEIANGGTFFLDEIGELPLELQGKLLRVLQDGEFERLGSTHTIKVNTRIIADTNRNLEEEVRKGRFREDLWYRLNIFPITSPPLRDRRDDIPLLVDYYVKRISKRMGKAINIISVLTMNALQKYHWPGNVRELENVIERAVINSSGPKLRLIDELKTPPRDLSTSKSSLAAVERDYILQVLELTKGKISGTDGAAEILDLDRSTLRARMKKLNIKNI